VKPEYAKATVSFDGSPLFEGLSSPFQTWMSHGDRVTKLPSEFEVLATSDGDVVAAVGHKNGRHFGVQFHPEVSQTPDGKLVLKNFVEGIAKCRPNYEKKDLGAVIKQKIREVAGDDNVLLLYSGGVDSSVCAYYGARALGKRLHAVTFDGGHLREGEIEEIRRNAAHAGVELTVIEASDAFIEVIGKTLDPEEKRAAFREVYPRLAREAARKREAKKIMQGTIAPDRIESGTTGAKKVKTHHNAKGLDFGNLIELNPLEDLYKDEVRILARQAKLPVEMFSRPPFPGPGNFIRITDTPVTREALQVVQWAEARTRELVAASEKYRDVAQLVVAVLGGPRTPGIKGDMPVRGYKIGIRAVRTANFMTVEGVTFDEDFQAKAKKILGEHPRIVHIGFFPMDKPPATTEFE
jgi:GMP synthase (glutamine-hydrolysing)